MNGRAPVLVLGLGNELLTDEGIGVAAARALASRDLPGVEVVVGGTLGLALVPLVEGRDGVLLLDAVVGTDGPPGRVVVLSDEQVPRRWRRPISPHELGIPEILAAAELVGRAPARVALVGMVPASLEVGQGLTPCVAEHLDEMVERALEILSRWAAVRA